MDDLLDALDVIQERLLPRTQDVDYEELQDHYISRAWTLEVLAGRASLSRKMAGHLSARLQFLVEQAVRDRELYRELVKQRESANGASDENLIKLLYLALTESTVSLSTAEQREEDRRQLLSRRTIIAKAHFRSEVLAYVDDLIAVRARRGTSENLSTKLRALSRRPRGLLDSKDKLVISKERMLEHFANNAPVRGAAAAAGQLNQVAAANPVVIPVAVPWLFDQLTEDDIARLEETLRVNGVNVRIRRVRQAEESCSTLYLELSAEDAQRLVEAFRSGALDGTQILDVGDPRTLSSSAPPLMAARGRFPFSDSFRSAIRRARLVRPWRRLRYLLIGSAAAAPIAHTLSESDKRAYAVPGLLNRLQSLRADLGMTLVLWPLLGATLAAVALLPFSGAIVPVGLLTGFALSLLGSQPCSILISPLACGAGTLVMGIAFSVVQAIALGRVGPAVLSAYSIRLDPFVTVVGGIIGLSAPEWRQRMSTPLIVILIASVALSIAYAGWLMAQPGRAQRRSYRFSRVKVIAGSLIGALAGSGIGAIYGLSRALGRGIGRPAAFIIAFSVVGALWMFASTAIRTGSQRRGMVVAMLHSIIGASLVAIAFSYAGTPEGLVALAASTGFFHSTFFTTAFVVGERLGGYRAAFAASAIEGAVGFTAFVISRML